ncbi:MinD/ParA family ATP-binding protein [Nocardia camponoti]|uniref:MinD/ParA family ATP-binding protein n=1 Tax=Nocardia camponoti TaxID=1616106 RepID=UPI001E401A26
MPGGPQSGFPATGFAPGQGFAPPQFGPNGEPAPGGPESAANGFAPGHGFAPPQFGPNGEPLPGESGAAATGFAPGFASPQGFTTPQGDLAAGDPESGSAQGGFAPPTGEHPAPTGEPQNPQSEAIYSWAPPPPQPIYQQPMQPGMPPQGAPGQPGQPQWQQSQYQPFQPQHVPAPGQPGHSINDLNLLRRARKSPRGGWRKAVHKASGGMINPGESAADVVHRDLAERVNQPVRGDYRIAILSLKGGVGKTTTTVGLGSTFASQRGDRVIAIDANPDLGTLAHRVPRQTRSTVRNLLEDQNISRYSDVRAHTSQAPSRLEVLASEQDPAVSEAFSEADYRKAIGILQSFYNIILTDCGTGLMHSAMAGVLDMASSLVLVTSPAIDGARSASATLDWLDHHGYSKLVERTVVVVNASRRGASSVDLDQLRKLFLDRTRAVQIVPFDDHLAEGAEIDLELVSKPTRRALLELAAMVADDFAYQAVQQGGFHPGHIPPGQNPQPGYTPQQQYPGAPTQS